MIEKPEERTIKNGISRDTSNIGHNTQNKDAQNNNKSTTQKAKKMKNTDFNEKP